MTHPFSLMTALLMSSMLISCASYLSTSFPTTVNDPSTIEQSTLEQDTLKTLPHCAEDRRPFYTVMEIPDITNLGGAPDQYITDLHAAMHQQIEKRAVWKLVANASTQDNVVTFRVDMLSWEADHSSLQELGMMEMKLSLIDKLLNCEINETTGKGTVLLDSHGNGTKKAIENIADGAGWFVENVLVHNQFNYMGYHIK